MVLFFKGVDLPWTIVLVMTVTLQHASPTSWDDCPTQEPHADSEGY